ncbi:MAG: hypothetical protein ACPGR7_05630 [Flavobacteriaceae bacterium]
MKFFATTIIAFFFVTEAAAFQVPPPPPPAGSELWAGTSLEAVETIDPDCTYCSGTYIALFDFCIGATLPCTDLADGNWDSWDLRKALEGSSPLPGGYLGFSSVLQGILDGALINLTNDQWDILVGASPGSTELASACNAARSSGYEPSACVDVPLPFFVEISLFLTGLLFIFKYHNPTQYQALLLKLRFK